MKYEIASADWKDIMGLGESFRKALKKFGLNVYFIDDGSDENTFIITKSKLTKKQVKDIAAEMLGFDSHEAYLKDCCLGMTAQEEKQFRKDYK